MDRDVFLKRNIEIRSIEVRKKYKDIFDKLERELDNASIEQKDACAKGVFLTKIGEFYIKDMDIKSIEVIVDKLILDGFYHVGLFELKGNLGIIFYIIEYN